VFSDYVLFIDKFYIMSLLIRYMNYKVPSPREIRSRFQKSENFIAHHFHRRISAYVTWFFLHFTLWAEAIAFLTPVVDALTIYLIYTNHWVWAAVLTQLHLVIDSSDGEIARFRGTVVKRTAKQNQFGGFFDSMVGLLVFPFIIFYVGFALGDMFVGLLGMGLFFINAASSAYVKIYFKKQKAITALKKKMTVKNYKIGFSSVIQKSLVTLAILFQSMVFIWLLIFGSAFMILARVYLYSRR